MTPPEPSFVVVLTGPSGLYRMLSHASLMYEDEAEREAEAWRRTPFPGIGEWDPEVRGPL